MRAKTYSEMIVLVSFEERYRYLQIAGSVGEATFGFDRYINQRFYKSQEWLRMRDFVISRDNGCDLGVKGHEIHGRIIVHHMNPLSPENIREMCKQLLDPEYLICTTHETHNAIHFGDERQLRKCPVDRKPNDTCPWRN